MQRYCSQLWPSFSQPFFRVISRDTEPLMSTLFILRWKNWWPIPPRNMRVFYSYLIITDLTQIISFILEVSSQLNSIYQFKINFWNLFFTQCNLCVTIADSSVVYWVGSAQFLLFMFVLICEFVSCSLISFLSFLLHCSYSCCKGLKIEFQYIS